MHYAYIGGRSENNIKCVVVHNDLGQKNRTTQYNCRFSAASLALRVIFSVSYLWNVFGSFTEPFKCFLCIVSVSSSSLPAAAAAASLLTSRHLPVSVVSSSRVMSAAASGSRVLSSRPVGSSSSGQKTILLVQAISKTSSSPSSGSSSSIQSLLLPSSMRNLTPVAAGDPVISANRLNNNIPSMPRLSSDSLTVTPARLGVRVVSVASSSTSLSPGQSHVDMQTPYGLVFNSRTIQADGTVCTSKEYLCNFCQFKVPSEVALLEHSSTHLFSCNHCSFRSTSRLDCLIHKRDSHPSTTDELAGFEDLDRPTLTLKTARIPRLVGTAFLPPTSSNMRLGASSVVPHPARTVGMSLLNTVSSSTRPVSSSCTSSSALLSNVVRTMSGKTGDSYFTYRIAHDADGRVQAYECDVCGFRSVHINEMFSHASTHSLADLAKSGAATVNNVVWECFYCSFSAPLQASVVSHVIASHPNQPIQLKRLPTTMTPAAVANKTPAEPAASTETLSPSYKVSPLPAEQPASDKTTRVESDDSGTVKSAEVKVERKKKSDASDEGCIWGCYYCSMQSASRNDIISHLKKQHSSEKLVVTRRRITHVATGSSGAAAGSKPPVSTAASACTTESKAPSHTTDTPGPELGSEESTKTDDIDKLGALGKSRKRHLSASASDDTQQLIPSSVTAADSGESSDGNQAVVGSASAKSRRKQVAPRRVADELAAAATTPAADDDKPVTNDNTLLSSSDAVNAVNSMSHTTSETMPAVTKTSAAANSRNSRSLLATSPGPRKHGRTSLSKYDSLIKKLKMAESEENGLEISSLLEKPRVDEPPVKASSTTRSHGKALSLLTGQMVTGYVQPPNGVPTVPTPSLNSAAPPVLNCETNTAENNKLMRQQQSSGLKVNIVEYVDVTVSDRCTCYVHDSERSTARCGVCGTTARGCDVLQQMQEHVAAHFNECGWACAYCAFQCSCRSAIVAHVAHRHCSQPLRIVRRRSHHRDSNKTSSNLIPQQQQQLADTLMTDGVSRQKLRGPRCHRDLLHFSTAAFMWQCAFCSRRSLFRGLIVIHMRLAHFDHGDDLGAVPQRWLRPAVSTDSTSQEDPGVKQGRVCLVRVEDVNRYPALSDVILSNGADLIRELDVDDAEGVGQEVIADGSSDAGEFRCVHCHFRGMSPAVVKCHILQTHQLEDVTALDLRSSRRLNHEHLLMCRSVECQFTSSVEGDFQAHMEAHPLHSTNNIATVSRNEPKAVDHPRRLSPQSKKLNRSLPVDVRPTTSARTMEAGGAKSRRGTDGPIEYDSNGTVKGLELASRASSMKIQCTHCCMVMSCDVNEMKSHLSSAHPQLVPLAIDVECTDTSLPASLFFCLVADCHFITSYYNVYKRHVDEEHPNSEPGSGSRHQRLSSSSAAKRRSAPNVHHDTKQNRSFVANVRRPKKPTSVLNSSMDKNGHCSPLMSGDGLAMLASPDDSDVTPVSRKSSSSHHYSSQDFDFTRRYKCVLCSHTAATLADMKQHLTLVHNSTTSHQCIDRRARQLRKRQGIYFCPDPNCAFCCKFDDELAVHMDQEHPSLVGVSRCSQPKSSADTEDSGCAGDRVYQCAHCTYITTDLRNVRVHVVAEHATTEGGFAEIKTAVSSDGSLIMNVNDALSPKSPTLADLRENGVAVSMSSVKVDDEGKVFAVL